MSKQTATPSRPVRTQPRQTPSRQTPGRTSAKKIQPTNVKPFQMPFDQKNIRVILLGIAVIVLGYIVMYVSPTMSTMALTISPIILLLGYCVIVPVGIMMGARKRTDAPIMEQSTNGAA
jgi:hypothetical protein